MIHSHILTIGFGIAILGSVSFYAKLHFAARRVIHRLRFRLQHHLIYHWKVGSNDRSWRFHLQMSAFELLSALGAKYLHHEENDICNVAFDKLVDKAGPLDLIKNGVNFVCLCADVLKYVVYFRSVEHHHGFSGQIN